MNDHSPLKETPLHALHVSLGARMVPFAGYDMPVQYPAGVLKEHLHTRTKCGLFDVSHTIAVPADAVTTGTGVSTVVGADKYDFENVQPADIISGSAHLKGTYLIPNPDNTPATGFSMLLTSKRKAT